MLPLSMMVTGSTVTKYYFAGAIRIAMRTGSTVSYLLTDHLGSTSITTNSAGALVSELRYKPWGEVRYSNGTTSTRYTYTGQFSNTSEFGLMYYGARWYDPALSRFTQADSIVPGGVQGLDRYAYVNNSPVRYTDPSGHTPCQGGNWDDGPSCLKNSGSRLSYEVAATKYQKDCRAGTNDACPGGTGGMVVFGVVTIVVASSGEELLPIIYIAGRSTVRGILWQGAYLCLRIAKCADLITGGEDLYVLGRGETYRKVGAEVNGKYLYDPNNWTLLKNDQFINQMIDKSASAFLTNEYLSAPGSVFFREVITAMSSGYKNFLDIFLYR